MSFEVDAEKLDEAGLVVLSLTLHDGCLAWKNLDFDLIDRLYDKGYIENPRNKRKSLVFTDAGLHRVEALLRANFAVD